MAKRKKVTKKVVKKTNDVVKTKSSFDEIRATVHAYGKQARVVLEEKGCSKCEKGKEKFVYTSTYIRGKRVLIEVVCITCKTKSKVLMPELSPDDV
jgi:hypothetical protein